MEDHTRTLAPGQVVQIAARGDFVYCKSAGKRWRLLINGAPIHMEKGDWRREPKPFEYVEIENIDTENPVTVTVVIGFGEYDRKIISGEITAVPGITSGSGEFIADTRTTYEWPLKVAEGPEVHIAGEALVDAEDSYRLAFAFHRDGIVYGMPDFNYGGRKGVTLYSIDTGAELAVMYTGWNFDVGHRGYAYDRKRDVLYLMRNDNTLTSYLPSEKVAAGQMWPQFGHGNIFSMAGQSTYGKLVGAYDGKVVMHDSYSAYVVWDRDADTVDRVNIPGTPWQGASYFEWDDMAGKWLMTYGSGYPLFEVQADFSGAEEVQAASHVGSGVYMGNNLAITTQGTGSGGDSDWRLTHQKDATFPGSFDPEESGLIKAQKLMTAADVTMQEERRGVWNVRGQVLKAAVGVKLAGQQVPVDYLDYIYRFEYTGRDGKRKVVDTGASSFAQLGIADDFHALTPMKVKITARRGLIE